MPSIIPNLWFNREALPAAEFYCSVFPNSKINKVTHYDAESAKVSGLPEGSVLTVNFWLDGHEFIALNGGSQFRFSEAVSFMIECKDQEEIDYYWTKLTADGGEESVCGWLKDKFGLSWQVTPKALNDMIADPDPVKASRVMSAMLQMKKLDLSALEAAYKGPQNSL